MAFRSNHGTKNKQLTLSAFQKEFYRAARFRKRKDESVKLWMVFKANFLLLQPSSKHDESVVQFMMSYLSGKE